MNYLESIDLENFKNYDFILYEQRKFRKLLKVYKENNVKFKIIAINLFKDREKAPILIDLKSMSPDGLEDFYINVFLKEFSNGFGVFNNLGMVNNLIKTRLSFDDFSKKITDLLIYNSKNIIRFYDPRVNIHLLNINGYINLNKDMDSWLKKFSKIFDEWCVCVFGCYFKFTNENYENNKLINFTIFDIDNINEKFKKNFFEKTQKIEVFLKESYQRLEVKG